MKYEKCSWDDIEEYCKQLASQIKKSGFKPDWIVGIARGGWVPARLLSDQLENSNISNMRVEFYSGRERRKEPCVTQEVSVDVMGKKILVVDDVSDSGESLRMIMKHLLDKGAQEVKVATLHAKPGTVFKPDFYIRETDAWIVYAWEKHECRDCPA